MAERALRKTGDAAILIALAAAALLFWKLRIVDPAEAEPFHPNLTNVDFFTYTVPVLGGAARAIKSGELPLWNPYQSAGHPFLAAVPGGLLYPLNFPFLVLPPHRAIEATVVLHLIAAGAFMYLYGRTISLLPVAAAAAALAFMFSGFVASRAVWFTPALAGCVWLPLAFLALEKIFARGRAAWMVLLGIAVAMPVLAGWLQTWTYSMYAIALYASVRMGATALAGARRVDLARTALLLAGGVVLGVSLAAVQLLPSVELQRLSPRRVGSMSEQQSLLFPGTPPARIVSDAVDPTPGPPRWNYLGVAALLLIPLSLLARAGRPRVACLWCLAALGLAAVFTVHTPLLSLFLKLPTGSWFRMPQRLIFLYAFGGSVLAGVGMQWLATRTGERSDRRSWLGVGVVVLMAAMLSLAVPVTGRGLLLLWGAGLAIGAAAFLPVPGWRSAALVALVALLAWDLFHATRNPHQHPYHEPRLAERERQVFDYVKERQGVHRTYIRSPSSFDFAVMPKHGTLEGIYAIADYEPLSLARDFDLFRLIDRRDEATLDARPFTGWLDADPASPHFELLDLMSVRFALAWAGDREFRDALLARPAPWREVFRPARGSFVVYENPRPLPRAYVAPAWRASRGGDEALAVITAPGFDPRRQAVVEGVEPASEAGDGRAPGGIVPARIVSYGPTEVVVDADAASPGHLVLTDSFYPGWKASVDGRPAPIHPANYLFRAVPLEAGRHRVTFTYAPLSFRAGAALSLLALCAIGAQGVWSILRSLRRRRLSSLAVCLMLAASPLAAGCGAGGERLPNVVVFVVDTLRPDHLGAYGRRRAVSPALDALAREGVVFERAVTVAPRTWQSFTSIVTGLYPPRHGVRYIFSRPLAPDVPTLGSVLAQAGYRTAAFDGMTFLADMTGGRAFQEYVDPRSLQSANPMLGDDRVVDAFIDWLERVPEPFFAFLRLSAPHWSYVCAPVFHDEVEGHDAISHRFNAGSHGLGLRRGGIGITDEEAYRLAFYDYDPPPDEREHMILHYDECVRASDDAIGRGLGRLRELRLFDSTIALVTSDHGESFGEHGYMQHGPRVDGPVMGVPLIVRFPDDLARGRRGTRVSQLVRTVDVFPTLVAALGLAVPPDLDGVSLLPAIDAGAELELTAYGEGGRAFVGVDPEIHLPGIAGKWRMLRSRDWKLVHVPDAGGGTDRLYHLASDPGETRDVASEHPEIAARLRASLDEVMAPDADAIHSEPSLTEEEKERLRALGYL